jgi:hypothetical protein
MRTGWIKSKKADPLSPQPYPGQIHRSTTADTARLAGCDNPKNGSSIPQLEDI